MKPLAEKALYAVVRGDVKIHPEERFLATYKYWLENVKDWCISRQLWWGQRIPAWYDEAGKFVVAENEAEAKSKFKSQNLKLEGQLRQDEDVLDTWFSSWLWPIEVFNGITQPNNKDINYYYPTSVLVTGQDIIFFWVARMIMAGMEYMNEKPFSDVYFTGMVRDKQGRKMSKSLGNSPDLLDLIDRYGADAVRFGIMISSPAGNDLLFDDSSCDQGRSFNNKIWNALKLVKMWESRVESSGLKVEGKENFAIDWFENRLNEAKAEIEKSYKEFKLSEALKTIYSLIWDDFCSWYLEWVKPGFEQQIEKEVYEKTVYFFEELMQLLHPFMPFITEEIYDNLRKRKSEDVLCIKQFASVKATNREVLTRGKDLKELLSKGRDYKKANNIKHSEPIKPTIPVSVFGGAVSVYGIIEKQLNAPEINKPESDSFPATLATTIYPFKNTKIGFESEHQVDKEKRREELLKDLEYQKGFLISVEKKLGNERFVQNAKPEIIEIEKKKKADAEAKIKAIEESLASL
jgi:valyl-tRNA synthetase